jgi:Flp pilus assembly protein TadB
VIPALAGGLTGLGVILITAGFTRPDDTGRGARNLTTPWTMRRAAPWIAGLLTGAVVLVATTWPAAGLGAGVLVGITINTITSRQQRPHALEAQLEAIATWCEQLRDLLRAGALLGPAIATTATTAPTAIAESVTRLAARLDREQPADALRRFADELDEPSADLVAGVLVTAVTHSGNTAELLTDLAALTRQRVERRKQIEAERASTRMDMRIVIIICVAAVVSMIVFARSEFLRPYRTVTGQTVLAMIFATYIAAVVWARRIATYTRPARFLTFGGRQ